MVLNTCCSCARQFNRTFNNFAIILFNVVEIKLPGSRHWLTICSLLLIVAFHDVSWAKFSLTEPIPLQAVYVYLLNTIHHKIHYNKFHLHASFGSFRNPTPSFLTGFCISSMLLCFCFFNKLCLKGVLYSIHELKSCATATSFTLLSFKKNK